MESDHMYCHNDDYGMQDAEDSDHNFDSQNDLLPNDEDKGVDDILIDSVKSYPHLYDTQCQDYRDVIKKENSWVEISNVLNMTPADCYNRWKRLRESFSREKKKRNDERKSGSGFTNRRGFVHFNSMSFLDKFVKPRRTVTNIARKPQPNALNNSSFINEKRKNSENTGASAETAPSCSGSIHRTHNQSPMVSPKKRHIDENASTSSNSRNGSLSNESMNSRPFSNKTSPLDSPTFTADTDPLIKQNIFSGKFNKKINISKGQKMKEFEKDELEGSVIRLNEAVTKHLEKKTDSNRPTNDPDDSFCDLIRAELRVMDAKIELIRKDAIMKILWRNENLGKIIANVKNPAKYPTYLTMKIHEKLIASLCRDIMKDCQALRPPCKYTS